MTKIPRRTLLNGIAAGTIGLTFVGAASTDGRAQYLVNGQGNGLRRRLERAGYAVRREIADGRVLIVSGPDDGEAELADVKGVKQAVRDLQFSLERPELVESAEATRSEQLFEEQWDKQVTDVPEAHETATGSGTTISIIDTGTHFAHPDLEPNLLPEDSRLFREGGIRSGEGEVIVPDESGTTTTTQHVAEDVDGHGSHVAGIAAGARNKVGIVGTAPDADVVSCRVFWWTTIENDEGEEEAILSTTTGDILTAIDYSAEIGVDAMNMSIGTDPIPPQENREGFRPIYQTVVQSAVRRGTVVVVSTGNSEANLQQGGYFTVPNSVAGAMSVSATGPNDELVFYSNYGTNEVSVGAPGGGYETLEKTLCTPEGIVAGSCEEDEETGEVECDECNPPEWPYPTNLVLSSVPPDIYGTYYAYFAGTSMAAPQVTGAAALVREVSPEANANQVEQAIEKGADLVRGKGDSELGAGRLNAANALETSVGKKSNRN